MNRIGVSLLAAFLVAACAPPSLYYQEGIAVTRVSQDLAHCALSAMKDVPVDRRTRLVPGTKRPKTYCDAAGQCRTIWVQVTPDRWETYDANEGLRRAYEDQCMIASGYIRVRLPACSDEIIDTADLTRLSVLPALSEQSCAVQLRGGGWRVITPS